jgi:hypothetical protein
MSNIFTSNCEGPHTKGLFGNPSLQYFRPLRCNRVRERSPIDPIPSGAISFGKLHAVKEWAASH